MWDDPDADLPAPARRAAARARRHAAALGGAARRLRRHRDGIERSLPIGDEEEWEYAALCEAVAAAGELREKDGAKRVVAAADVDPDWVTGTAPATTWATVEVTEAIPLRNIVSFHIDEQPGADGAEDLLWYDATELDEVTRLM